MLRATKRGFTLIELMVVMALAAIVVGGIGVSIVNIRKADLKAASGMMGGAMRYMYNLAVINNTPYRLVIDMDESAFWGEELQTDDPCARFLPLDDESEAEDETEDEVEDEGPVGLDPKARARRVQAGNFTRTKDNLLSLRKLPQGIVVTGVMTSLNQGPRQGGKVAIHFFPGGHAEPAYIWLGERDDPDDLEVDPTLTLELDSLMGRVTRHNEALSEQSFAKGLDS